MFSFNSKNTLLWSLLDQLFFALANFLINIYLARVLDTANYGNFSITYSIYLFLTTIHTASFSEPMMIFGSKDYALNFDSYLNQLLKFHWLVTAIAVPILLVVYLILMSLSVFTPQSIIALIFSIPFLLYALLIRRACYLSDNQRIAAIGGMIYFIFSLALFLGFASFYKLNEVSAFGLMGFSSLVSGLWIQQIILKKPKNFMISSELVLKKHVSYGIWSIPGNLLSWIPLNLPILILSAIQGASEAGKFRALLNLILPISQLVGALNTFILPMFSRIDTKNGYLKFLRRTILLISASTLLYWLFLGIFNQYLIKIYGEKFVSVATYLWILGLAPVFDGIIIVFSSLLRSLNSPKTVFISYLFGGLVASLFSYFFIQSLGLLGAIVASVISFLSISLTMAFFGITKLKLLKNEKTISSNYPAL